MPSTLTSRTLDLIGLEAASAAARALAAFDALEPGGRVELRARGDLGLLLARLQAERPGAFEWSPLAEGPELVRVELARRTTEGRARCVSEALASDHDRLEQLEQDAFEARASGRFALAQATYSAFAFGLRRHIGFEEDLLFPEFERRSGISADAGPTAVMRAEHRTIEALIAAVERAIGEPSADPEPSRQELHELLTQHNAKEEQILYPGADRLMAADARDELVRRIQAYRR